MRTRFSCGLAVCFGLLSLSTAVHAQTSASSKRSACEATQEADRLREAGDLLGALERYTIAYTALREPTLGLKVAKVQAELGMLQVAHVFV